MSGPDLARALDAVRQRVEAAARRSGRDPAAVTLIAVTKTFDAAVVDAAIGAGIRDVGENRVQEFRDKRESIGGTARWHLIGHLQSNKAKEAVRLFDVIQTLDSESLARKVARAAEEQGKVRDVLVQVNLGQESQKSGVEPGEVPALLEAVSRYPSLRCVGLMAIPPFLEPEAVRPYFRRLRNLREELAGKWPALRELSMGMSDDYEVAVEEGATMIRLGRALFGEREQR